MQSKPSNDKDLLALSKIKPGGRVLFGLLAVLAAGLLIMLGAQTEVGFDGGGWWNEPRNGPLFSLSLLFVFSSLAAIFASPKPSPEMAREALVALLLSGAFLCAIGLISKIGYGLSVLLFVVIAGLIAGYRGRKLLIVSVGLMVLMLIIFRYVLGLWFPRAELFKLTPWLEAIGGYL